MPESILLTKAEAAEYLHLSLATIDRLIKSRDLPHIKVGKKVLFRIRDLEAFIDVRCIPQKKS